MCPPLSCCHRWHTRPGALRQQLYHLVRLLLASGEEISTAQQAAVAKRLDELWDSLHGAMRQYYRVSPSRAQDLTSQVVHALLREECCRQSICSTVSLAEALGLSELAPGLVAQLLASPQPGHPLARRLAHE